MEGPSVLRDYGVGKDRPIAEHLQAARDPNQHEQNRRADSAGNDDSA
jgi:hypothetical protein